MPKIPSVSQSDTSLLIASDLPATIVLENPESSALARDVWCGVLSAPVRKIPGTPFVLSSEGCALPQGQEYRENAHGYDRDNPQDAIAKYEKSHDKPILKSLRHAFIDVIFNLFTIGVPKLLSLSAGKQKQRIDQKVLLRIVRESVDKFPELKIRVPESVWSLMSPQDQIKWREQISVIRVAQHDYIANQLTQKYPGHINQDAPTILYTGGRAAGLLRILYCSVDEYVALYWSDWGLKSTDSGSYRAHVYDYITEGQNVNWNARHLEYSGKDFEVTEPGEYTFLGAGDRKIWSFEGPCGMVDHGIGDVISMSKFALVSNFTSTLNMDGVASLLVKQAKALAHEYVVRFKETLRFSTVEVKEVSHISADKLAEAQRYFAQIMERANLLP